MQPKTLYLWGPVAGKRADIRFKFPGQEAQTEKSRMRCAAVASLTGRMSVLLDVSSKLVHMGRRSMDHEHLLGLLSL